MNRARDVSVRAEDLCDFIYHYASPEDSNSSFCGLRRVLRWCQAIVELAAEASCIKGTIDYYFEEQRLPSQVKADARFMDFCRRITNATEVFYNVLLAARDYVEGLALEHGQKLSLAEVVDRFKKFNSQCTVQIMPSLSEQEGVYASLEYLTLVIDNLTKNINEHGDKKRPGVRLVISRQDKEVRIEVRNFGTIRPDMLELGEYLDWQGNPGRTQKMFLRGTSEKEVPEGEVGVGGEIIREVVEFMQGRVSAYNNGEEAVIVLTFQYAA